MADRKLAEELDNTNSNRPFEYYENKYSKEGYDNKELYAKIIVMSTRTNSMVNKSLGIG